MAGVAVGSVVLGEGTPKVLVPLTGASVGDVVAQASAAAHGGADIIEWRVDLFGDHAPAAVVEALRAISDAAGAVPLLVTFRTAAEGGSAIEPDAYAALYRTAIASGLVAAVDVEVAFDEDAGDAVMDAADAAGVAVVGSFHDFAGTPSAGALVARCESMWARGCDVAKVAVMPKTPEDVLTLLAASSALSVLRPGRPVIAIAMGGLGVVTRLAGQVFGSCATFATTGDASAPGQMPVNELRPVLRLIADGLAPKI
jgi:3-dehydroquinate dehydratase I